MACSGHAHTHTLTSARIHCLCEREAQTTQLHFLCNDANAKQRASERIKRVRERERKKQSIFQRDPRESGKGRSATARKGGVSVG